jgi:hypothetical protein
LQDKIVLHDSLTSENTGGQSKKDNPEKLAT